MKEMTKDNVIGEIFISDNYSKFKLRQDDLPKEEIENRKVDKNLVKKIVKSIKTHRDYGHLFPIIVNGDFEILDGQHRFTARKELSLPIYYIVDRLFDPKHLGGINDAMKKWSKNDFVEVSGGDAIVNLCDNIIEEIGWSALTYSALAITLNINLKNILAGDEELSKKEYTKLENKKDDFILYMKALVDNVIDIKSFYARTSRAETVCKFAKKLIRLKIPVEEIKNVKFIDLENSFIIKGYLPPRRQVIT